MSKLSDAISFETFHLKDLWTKLREDPWRPLVGSVGPWSTKIWNNILNRDDEPFVDQMGGAYGGRTLSVGSSRDLAQREGVYRRAQESGIDIGAGANMQNAAHVIAAIYGAQGLGGIGGDGGSTSVGGGYGSNAFEPGSWDAINAGTAGSGGTGFGSSGLGPVDYSVSSGYGSTPFGSGSWDAAQAGGGGGGGAVGGIDWSDPQTYQRLMRSQGQGGGQSGSDSAAEAIAQLQLQQREMQLQQQRELDAQMAEHERHLDEQRMRLLDQLRAMYQ